MPFLLEVMVYPQYVLIKGEEKKFFMKNKKQKENETLL